MKLTCSSTTGPHWHCLRHPPARLGDILVCLSEECHLWLTGGVSASRHGWSGRGSGVVGCGLLLEGASADCPMRRRSSRAVWLCSRWWGSCFACLLDVCLAGSEGSWSGWRSIFHAKLALFCWRSLDCSDSCATMPTNIRWLSSVYSASSEIKIQAVTTILNFLVNTTGYGFEIWHTVSHRSRLFNRNNHQKSSFMFPLRHLLKSIGANNRMFLRQRFEVK